MINTTPTIEKMIIDILAAWEAYNDDIVYHIICIWWKFTVADAME